MATITFEWFATESSRARRMTVAKRLATKQCSFIKEQLELLQHSKDDSLPADTVQFVRSAWGTGKVVESALDLRAFALFFHTLANLSVWREMSEQRYQLAVQVAAGKRRTRLKRLEELAELAEEDAEQLELPMEGDEVMKLLCCAAALGCLTLQRAALRCIAADWPAYETHPMWALFDDSVLQDVLGLTPGADDSKEGRAEAFVDSVRRRARRAGGRRPPELSESLSRELSASEAVVEAAAAAIAAKARASVKPAPRRKPAAKKVAWMPAGGKKRKAAPATSAPPKRRLTERKSRKAREASMRRRADAQAALQPVTDRLNNLHRGDWAPGTEKYSDGLDMASKIALSVERAQLAARDARKAVSRKSMLP